MKFLCENRLKSFRMIILEKCTRFMELQIFGRSAKPNLRWHTTIYSLTGREAVMSIQSIFRNKGEADAPVTSIKPLLMAKASV